NGLDFRYRYVHEARRLVAHREVSLATRPDGETAITVPHGRARMGLNVALVHGGGEGLLLHNDVGFLEAFVNITQVELEMIRQVRAWGRIIVVQEPPGTRARVGE